MLKISRKISFKIDCTQLLYNIVLSLAVIIIGLGIHISESPGIFYFIRFVIKYFLS